MASASFNKAPPIFVHVVQQSTDFLFGVGQSYTIQGEGVGRGWAGVGPWGLHMLQTNALKASTHVTVELAILFLSVTAFSTCLLHA